MIATTNEHYSEIIKGDRTIYTQIINTTKDVTYGDGITTATVNIQGFSSDNVLLGDVCSNELVFTVDNTVDTPLLNDVLKPIQTIGNEAYGDEIIQVGVFNVTSVKHVDGGKLYSITAYDNVYKLNKELTLSNATTFNTLSLINAIETQCGVTVKDKTSYNVNFNDKMISDLGGSVDGDNIVGINASALLGYIACYFGKSVRATNTGSLEFYWWYDSGRVIDRDEQVFGQLRCDKRNYITLEQIAVEKRYDETDSEGEVSEKTVTYKVNRDDVVGEPRYIMNLTHSQFTQERLNTFKTLMNSITYLEGSVKFGGDPTIEVGDIVGFINADNETDYFLISNYNLILTGMSGTITSSGDVSNISFGGSISNAIANMKVQMKETSSAVNSMNAKVGKVDEKIAGKMSIVDYCSAKDTTKIDGANIYAKSVSADKINARGLTVVNEDNVTTLDIDENGNVEMMGEINAKSGTIGGFTIGEDSIYSQFEVLTSIWNMILSVGELAFMNSDEAKSMVFRQDGISGDGITIENRKGTMYLLSEVAQFVINDLLINSNVTFAENKVIKLKTLTSSQVTITSGSAYTFEIPIGVSNINVIGIPQLYIENGTGGNGESWINIYKTRTTASTVNVTVRNTYTGSCKVRCVCEIAYITIA